MALTDPRAFHPSTWTPSQGDSAAGRGARRRAVRQAPDVGATAMYLVIGHESDPLSQRVATALRGHGHEVALTPEPLSAAGTFTWALETHSSESQIRGLSGRGLPGAEIEGVLVRALGGPLTHDGWSPEDFAYVQAEVHALLLAWLWSLPCRVVNRMSADLWFRPQRAYPEWHPLLVRSGLPVLATQITNDLAAARAFSAALGGAMTYAPLTSAARYPVAEDHDWEELGKVMAVVPVCLAEPCMDASRYACLVGNEVVWDGRADPGGAEQDVFADGLRRLAAMLRLDVVQIEIRLGQRGLRCTGVDLYPHIASYGGQRQEALVAGVVAVLEGES